MIGAEFSLGDPAARDHATTTSTTASIRLGKAKLARCPDPKACPTANKNFRIALTQAIDKQSFIAATFAGLGKVANSFVMPGLPGYDEIHQSVSLQPRCRPSTHGPGAPGSLGFASAADIPPLKFGFNTGAGHEPRVAFLAEAWRSAFGLETEQIGSEFAVFLTQRTAGEYDIARNSWGADYPHANNQLSGCSPAAAATTTSSGATEEFDACSSRRPPSQDLAKQATLYQQAQKIMADDAASLFLLYRDVAALVKPIGLGARDDADGLQRTPASTSTRRIQILAALVVHDDQHDGPAAGPAHRQYRTASETATGTHSDT